MEDRWVVLLLLVAGVFSAISTNSAARYTACSSQSNSLRYFFSGTLEHGQRIGIFAAADVTGTPNNGPNDLVAFGGSGADKLPVLEILPSKYLTSTNTNLASFSYSPSTTSSFSLPVGDVSNNLSLSL
eukprot:CAMPEP_0175093628 /NCGR_PEP_ID=MMETSP0086_2-20121207/3126_1 /TAXON_ID=136419 /ORGANISM="Unknown Unknown, Strain D1" /LENGTH=127 /DNA_ID=CAMNT_0016366627 /DNA_START=51 /DNA_END=431 /DNA_ORIENTATION=-